MVRDCSSGDALWYASVSDAGECNEVDDKEFTQKNSVERLQQRKSLSIIQRIRLAEMWQEAYTADTWRAVSRALSSLPGVHMRIFLNYGLRLTEREESGFTSP